MTMRVWKDSLTARGGHPLRGGLLLPLRLLFLTFLPRGVRASVRAHQTRGRGLHVRIAMRVHGVALRVEVPGLSVLGKGELLLWCQHVLHTSQGRGGGSW